MLGIQWWCLVLVLWGSCVLVSCAEVGLQFIPVQVIQEEENFLNLTRGANLNSDDSRWSSSDKCPQHEEFLNCGPTCQKTCGTINTPCPGGTCVSGCFCKSGKVRSSLGVCISKRHCPTPDCPKNEVYLTESESTNCEPHCDSCDSSRQGVAGCFCKSGYARDSSGDCIKFSSCKSDCGENEKHLSCGYECREKCGSHFLCTQDRTCSRHCFCKHGFVRIDGKCVEKSECVKNCPLGQFPACIDPCAELCDQSQCESPDTCEWQCACPAGQKRTNNGECVAQCPSTSTCPAGETKECVNPCSQFCDTSDCIAPPECVNICICPAGQKRRNDGVCVPEDSCPLICPAGEIERCIAPCSELCDSGNCPATTPCVRQCTCPDGQKRLADGTCVAANTCPLNCPTGEVEGCINRCSELCDSRGCSAQVPCVRQCICPAGQKRLADGTCVPENTCPLNCPTGESEGCINRCSELCISTGCTPQVPCVRQCKCPAGQYRLPNGNCVPESSCPLVCPIGEIERCINPCSELCDARQCTPPASCRRQCSCPIGQKRNPAGNCVLEFRCSCPNQFESYFWGSECTTSCRSQSCWNVRRTNGCYCSPPYKRHATSGLCVRPNSAGCR